MIRITPALARSWLPERKAGAHKGDFGHVLVVAGSRGMTGAAVLAAKAALRAGAGLVTVAVPASQQPIVASHLAEAQTLPLPETAAGSISAKAVVKIRLVHRERGYSVLALGPGLSTHPDTARAVIGLLGGLDLPAVVDADALNILAGHPREAALKLLARRRSPCVFTPHPGEATRLLRLKTADIQEDRAGAAVRLAEEFGVVIVLKGRGTVISDGARAFLNPTGNAGLAKGGSGDALAGVIAALWSQRLSRRGVPAAGAGREAASAADRGLDAAALGVYLHGLSADIAVRTKTVYGLLAGDVIEALPGAFAKLR